MRALGVLVLVGCGRFGFDTEPLGDNRGDAPSADARVAPCTGPDEDSDGFPNACDNCPTEPNADQRDELEIMAGVAADGVGDACDPRPAESGDSVFMFDAFAVRDDDRYTYYGTTAYVDDSLRLGLVGGASGEGQAFFAIPLTVTRVDTAFTVVEHSPTAVQWVGVWTDISSDDEQKIFNEAALKPSDGNTLIRIKEDTGSVDRYSTDIMETGAWKVGKSYRMIVDPASATDGSYTLSVSIDGGAVRQTSIDIVIPRGDRAFLESEEMVSDFAYVIVYQR